MRPSMPAIHCWTRSSGASGTSSSRSVPGWLENGVGSGALRTSCERLAVERRACGRTRQMNAWPPTPSKQRAPLLVQAGWSGRGRKFAAKHAELIFIAKSNPHEIRQGLEEIWTIAEARGHARDDVKSLTVLRIPLTAGDVRKRFANVTRGTYLILVGTAEQVAGRIDAHAWISGTSGYMLNPLTSPGTLEDFVELVVPALQKRGFYRTGAQSGSLRARLRADRSDCLPASAYGSSFRFPA